MPSPKKIRVLFICMGNICRSPTAEGVFRAMAQSSPYSDWIDVDSAGTTDYHTGSRPDPRAIRIAADRGYDLSRIRARQVVDRDFERFDYLLAMDDVNLKQLQSLCPPEHAGKLELLLEYGDDRDAREVPDPYYGSTHDFEHALSLIENGCRGLLTSMAAHFPAAGPRDKGTG